MNGTKRTIIAFVLCFTFITNVYAQSQDEVLDNLFSVMRVEEATEKNLKATIEMQRAAMPMLTDEMAEKFVSRTSKELIPAMKKVMKEEYPKYFSVEEMKELTAFYKTPLGKKLLESQPPLQKKMMAEGMKIGQSVMMKIMQEGSGK